MKLVTWARLPAPIFLSFLLVASSGWGQRNYKILHKFPPNRFTGWEGGLVFDSAGDLFGTTMYGAEYDLGQVFKLMRNADGSWEESTIHTFSNSDGVYPAAGLIFDSAGNLYGTASQGPYQAEGMVFKLAPATHGEWSETVLHDFLG